MTAAEQTGPSDTEHVDVLIVGAGLSGIGAAWRLQDELPGTSYAIVEAREDIGGTWDLFRYPGVRSDSDMFTLAYPFKPWRDPKSMASGESIRSYIKETAQESGIRDHIRFGTKVLRSSWSSETATWTVRTSTGTFVCSFLYVCAGYYDYDQGYQPEFPGRDDFAGTWVHPQFWPDDLDYAGKNVVVIGSGATAVTLIPAMAETAGHVTMLQRSPSYLTALPSTDPAADKLRSWLPPKVAHTILRLQYAVFTQGFYQLARRRPERVKKILRGLALKFLKDPAYVDEHFTPTYDPWDQRLCVVPEGDFFRTIRAGKASVVTDHIDRITPTGVRLRSGSEIPADVIVSATGLNLSPLGGMEVTVDGERIDVGDTVAYRGLMLSGIPNLALCIGYVNASWTLRANLVWSYVNRLLAHMDRHGYAIATPLPAQSSEEGQRPLLDLTSGYIERSKHLFPKQGEHDPWTVRQNFLTDSLRMNRADVTKDMTFVPRNALHTPTKELAS